MYKIDRTYLDFNTYWVYSAAHNVLVKPSRKHGISENAKKRMQN